MTLNEQKFDSTFRARYQFIANYLTLFTSDWLKGLKLDLGFFNRIVFQEGNDKDLSIVGDKAFRVCVKQEFEGFENLSTDERVHNYFVKKYLEGFERIDQKFNLNFTGELRSQIEQQFKNGLKYETKAKVKKVKDVTVQAIHRYKYDKYELVVQIIGKNKKIAKEKVVFECKPDPFVVHFDVNRVEIENNQVRVINKIREETLKAIW